MPIQAKGRFPKPSTTFKDDGRGGMATKVVIEEYRALKNMPRGDEALKLLQSIGLVVKPIMIKHRWNLPLLVEIYPKQQSLLGFNVNSGRKIALRLRHASDHNDFIDQESIIETMLHELAHNLRGPHDEIFFQHLDLLTKEWYELQTSSSHSLPGQGFLTDGLRLGGAAVTLNPRLARQRAAEMAEKRRRMAELMEDGAGRRLGGGPIPSSLILARAEAAERRRNITHNCPSSSQYDTEVAAQEQEEEEILHGIQVITIDDGDNDEIEESSLDESKKGRSLLAPKRELVSSDEDDLIIVDIKKAPKRVQKDKIKDDFQPNLVKQTRAAAALRTDLLARQAKESNRLEQNGESSNSSNITLTSRSWNCQRCTLLNTCNTLVCQACNDIRPGLEHWICTHCQHRMLGDDNQYWLCTKCGKIKTA